MAKKIHVSEDEQLEKLKTWWQNNGTGVVTGVALGLVLIVGFNWWTKHQDKQALNASVVFSQLLEANQSEDTAKVVQLGMELKDNFAKLDYAAKGVILTAISQIKSGDSEAGKSNLQWVIENSNSIDNQLLAQLRLARQLYREADYDQALELVQIEDKAGFESQYFELIGDIKNKQGQSPEAREAYLKAMETMPPVSAGSGYRDILQLKINNTAS